MKIQRICQFCNRTFAAQTRRSGPPASICRQCRIAAILRDLEKGAGF